MIAKINESFKKSLLPLAAGLQWGVSLMVTGLVAGFPHIGPQLDYQIQILFFVGYVVFFFMLLPRLRNDPSFFYGKTSLLLAALLSVIGCLLLLFPIIPVSSVFIQSVLAPIMFSFANMFSLFFMIQSFSKSDPKSRIVALAISALVACVVIVLPTLVKETYFAILFMVILIAKWICMFLLSPEIENSRKVTRCFTAQLPAILYALYGVGIGSLPGFDAIRSAALPSDTLLVAGIGVAVSTAAFFAVSRRMKGLRTVAAVVIVLSGFAILVFELSVYASIHAAFIFTYLLYWAFLQFGVPRRNRPSSIDPLALIVCGFAIGWIVSRLINLSTVSDYPQIIGGLSIAASVTTLVVPLYAIIQGYRESSKLVDRTPIDPLESVESKCAVVSEAYGLTNREKEVFVLVAAGYNRKYICEKLVISEGTARTHIKHIYRKIGVHSKEELLELVHTQL